MKMIDGQLPKYIRIDESVVTRGTGSYDVVVSFSYYYHLWYVLQVHQSCSSTVYKFPFALFTTSHGNPRPSETDLRGRTARRLRVVSRYIS
jgi:hypothetical protein